MVSDKFRFPTLTAVVIANMVGTGVFTSLGFQLLDIRSGFALLALWAIGGVAALCGAMTYSELGAALPRSGGEYNLLSRIYHPAAGFVSGWVSSTVGFSGPVALAAMTFAAYASSIFPEGLSINIQKLLAAALLIMLTGIHATNHKNSSGTQVIFTLMKIGVILAFVFGTLIAVDTPPPVSFLPAEGDFAIITSGAYAVALIYVSFAYTGWNAATYLSSELEDPQRTLPWILISGTAVVTLLYLGLNFSFLYAAPMDLMAGQVEIGAIAAQAAFGETAGRLTGLVLAMLLISTVSAMTMAGPRVIQVIGEDYPAIGILGRKNRSGIPATAIWIQSSVALIFIISSTFESVLVFSGFTLALNSFVTIAGIFVLRYQQPDLERPYQTFLYPLPPLLYLLLTGWILGFTLISRPVEGLFSLGFIGSGLIFYWLAAKRLSSRRAYRNSS